MGSLAKRLVGVTLALTLAWVSVASYDSWRRTRDQLIELLSELGTGAREPGVVSDVRREPDPMRARLLVGRALLADELDRRWLAELSEAEREATEALSLRKLETAASLAREALAVQPASWQARMILAGSTYLEMSRRGDPRRWKERSRWEEPLRNAMAMATSQIEPRRILAAAYLNDWSLMTAQERESARDVLRVAFRDRRTLEQLLPAWLVRASTLDEALDLMPADLRSWQLVQQHFRVRRDWERVCVAQTRSLEILPYALENVLNDAQKRLAGGDVRTARRLALHALAQLPVGPVYTNLLERTLRTLPPGPIEDLYQQRTKEWLAWARRECLLSSCPLPRNVIDRLRSLSQYDSSADRAWVAELAGDLYSAETHERDFLIPDSPDWAPYLLLKAQRLANSGQAAQALTWLAMVSTDWSERAVTKAVETLVRKELGVVSRDRPGDWQSPRILHRGNVAFREYFWVEPPERVRLRFGGVVAEGAGVEVLWSDRREGCYKVGSGAVVTIDAPLEGGFHVLETRPLSGSKARLSGVEDVR